MTESGRRTELFVGAFLFIGLSLLGALILQFGRFQDYFGKQYPVTVVFEDASGLIKGSEVRMGGAEVPGQHQHVPIPAFAPDALAQCAHVVARGNHEQAHAAPSAEAAVTSR